MPIVQIASKLVYFAHVPKCAGSSVEDYLAARFGRLGFLDRSFLQVSQSRRWTRSSPQHIHIGALDRLLPSEFFSARFAVVRHPVRRLQSVYRFQRDIEGTIPAGMMFSDWLDTLGHLRRQKPFHLDNHYRPMSDFVPEGAVIFRLENGLDPLIAWLDDLAGDNDGARQIELSNTYDQRLQLRNIRAGPETSVTEADKHKIEVYCPEDFTRFGYTLEKVE